MYRGINILQFYKTVESIPWFNSDNKDNVMLFYTGHVPPVILYSLATVTFAAPIKLINALTGAIVASYNGVVTPDVGGYYRIKLLSQTVYQATLGFYYLQVATSEGTVRSDVFGWVTDLQNKRWFQIVSQNLTLAGTHNVPLSELEYWYFIVNYNGHNTSYEIQEDGVEKPYGNIPVFNTLNIKHTIEIPATKAMLKFLYTLRILEVNGTITTLTLHDREVEIFGFEITIKEEYDFGDFMIVEFTYREKDYISTRNAI